MLETDLNSTGCQQRVAREAKQPPGPKLSSAINVAEAVLSYALIRVTEPAFAGFREQERSKGH
ncbi:hypothetical protein CDL15_Pgr000167 [Punica granatum]|uniref:Uncharacterized protein n=1 Tax=Punica granatum TaxID=22663 RepID=A0A218Y1R3_PUNGR|nr:hypothetical protein CDL15_Pgr000167 [Punica granatum]